MTTGCPRLSLAICATMRAPPSAPPPAGNGTTSSIWREGYGCSCAASGGAAASTAATAPQRRDNKLFATLLVCAEVDLGVAVQHFLQHLARIAFRVPVGHHLLVPEHREITAEHDAISPPAGARLLQGRAIPARSPRVQI